ncbi:MAG: hypothetical protein JWO19_3062 [Bryobacterales bacterium]|nr:hypothetical protein [Bryobacterales bacterium]
MLAYVIFIRERTTDKSELDAYAKLAPSSLEGPANQVPGGLRSPGGARRAGARGRGNRRISVNGRGQAMVRESRVSSGGKASIQRRDLSRPHC